MYLYAANTEDLSDVFVAVARRRASPENRTEDLNLPYLAEGRGALTTTLLYTYRYDIRILAARWHTTLYLGFQHIAVYCIYMYTNASPFKF